MKKFEVAVIVDKNGNIIGAFKCKMCDEKEYKELMAKTQLTLDNKDMQINKLKEEIKEQNKVIDDLVGDIKLLKGE